MKNNLAKCRYCHQSAEQGWLIMDEVWSSYYVGCSNDLCDAMISMEVVSEGKVFRGLVEKVIQQAWNEINVCGSGTTIIAGENLKRKVRACEISPAYVAVTL